MHKPPGTGLLVALSFAGLDSALQLLLIGWQASTKGDVPGGLGFDVSQVGAVGVMAWIMWYTLRHALPEINQKFHDSLEGQRSDFRDELRVQREAFNERLEQLGRLHEADRAAFMKCSPGPNH